MNSITFSTSLDRASFQQLQEIHREIPPQPELVAGQDDKEKIDTIYGPIHVSLRTANLIRSPLVARLKGIHQTGCAYFIDPRQTTTRYEHSLGALALAQLLGGSESEQIAALLHDISHTAFSHVVDLVFANSQQNYHDIMREKFLSSEEAKKTIKDLNLTEKELNCEVIALVKGKGLNVDRLDYCIRDLLAVGLITQEEYLSIVHNLVVNNEGQILCKDLDTARLIFNKFIDVNEKVYFDTRVEVASIAVAIILKRMLDEGALVEEDFFATDDLLLQKISASRFKEALDQIGPHIVFSLSAQPTAYPALLRKLRYVDPMIQGLEGNLLSHCPASKKRLDEYLKTETTLYFSIPFLETL